MVFREGHAIVDIGDKALVYASYFLVFFSSTLLSLLVG